MSWSFSIGRLLGSELRVHATFFLLLAWIGTAAWIAEGPWASLVNVLFILSLFVCVVAHEFGHALMARRYGIQTPDITLLPIGGLARLERLPEDPGQEVAVAIAGPAVNVVIWAMLSLLSGFDLDAVSLQFLQEPEQGFFVRLATLNLFLVVFNMIPAFPMDGGRVLRAVLTLWFGRLRATRIAASAGQLVAFLFLYLGLTGGNPLLVLIAVFVFMAAAAESSSVAMHEHVRGVPVGEAMITRFESLSPRDPVSMAVEAILHTSQTDFPVLTPDGALAGFLARKAVIEAISKGQQATTVADWMSDRIPEVRSGASLEAALDALDKPEVLAVAVTGDRGELLGFVTRENLGEWIALRVRNKA